MPIDPDALADELVRGTKALLAKEMAKVFARMDALSAKVDALPTPKDGADGKDGAPGANGKDADPAEVAALVRDQFSKEFSELRDTVKAIPAPKDGADGKDGAPGADGKDVDMDAVNAMVQSAIDAALDAIPAPKDGADGKDGAPGEKGDPGSPGADGKDGADVVSVIKDADGHLHLTLSNGQTKDVGRVVGRDGANGEDGADGLGFDDMEAEFDGDRTLTLKWARGEKSIERKMTFAVPIDRGTFDKEKTYTQGDGVTYGGSWWIAQEETKAAPGTDASWRLATKKGRDGKNAKEVK